MGNETVRKTLLVGTCISNHRNYIPLTLRRQMNWRGRQELDVECEYFMISGWNKSKNIVDLNFSSFKTLGPK